MCDRIFVLNRILHFEIHILRRSQADSEMAFSFNLKNEKSATGRAQKVKFKQSKNIAEALSWEKFNIF